MDNLESQLQALFDSAHWTEKEYSQFLELLDTYSPVELQAFFQENYIARLSQLGPDNKVHADKLLQQIHERLQGEPVAAPIRALPSRRSYRWWAVAAIFIFLGGLGIWLFILNKQANNQPPTIAQQKTDVAAPVSTRAMITLSNGQQVYLDSAVNGQLAQQGNVNVVKDGNGAIAYHASPAVIASGYNTLSNPRGSNIVHLSLSDGTQVWLNAESSLRYPVAFNGRERSVEITGEAYFEVAHNAAQPFTVKKAGSDWAVQVLGTHFNVNAYGDEPASRVTLLEGSVKLTTGNQPTPSNNVILKPGEQGVLNNTTLALSKAVNTDLDQVMAWKNGLFNFDGAHVPDVMRQLSRWYDIQVVYENGVPGIEFVGEMSKNIPLSGVLNSLQGVGLHFRLEAGHRLVILP